MRSLLSGEERDRFNSYSLGNVAVLIGVVALYLSDKAESAARLSLWRGFLQTRLTRETRKSVSKGRRALASAEPPQVAQAAYFADLAIWRFDDLTTFCILYI